MGLRAALILLLAVASMAEAAPRSRAAVAQFKLQQPCPATGQTRGACPGYVVDHIEPLCANGADAPSNMQWQPADEAKAKDRQEWARCRALKKQ